MSSSRLLPSYNTLHVLYVHYNWVEIAFIVHTHKHTHTRGGLVLLQCAATWQSSQCHKPYRSLLLTVSLVHMYMYHLKEFTKH